MSKQDDTQPGNSEHDEQSHPADNPGDPHSEDGSETLMDPGLVKPFDSEPALSERDPAGQTFELPSDPTVFEDTSQAEQATLADLPLNASHDRSSATIAGNLVDDVAAESELDDRTTVEPELPHAPTAGFENEHSDATIVQSAKPGDSQSADEISNADGTQVSHAAEDVDRTTADSVRSEGSQGGTVPDGQTPDHDATIIEGVSADPDMTIVEGATGADNSSNTGPTAVDRSDSREASGAGNWEKTRDANEKKQHPAGKGVHETANRWDFEQRYQLVNNFARGGLGQIWMANDSRLRREVAYKELLPTALKNRNALERFLEEAQITGQLEHPGIVPIYDIGYQENGTPFYAMKLVRGETMEKEIAAFHQIPRNSPEWTLTFRKLLSSFIDICNALAFAHDRGVLHRDLKPLNVMIGAFGETLVLDWGLAKVIDVESVGNEAPITTGTTDLDSDGETIVESQVDGTQAGATGAGMTGAGASVGSASMTGQSQVSGTFGSTRKMVVTDVRTAGSQTMMGSVMGTPAYMPPEQASGKLDELDARSDIYSLGGILYKLLTNQQPIARGKIRDVLKNVMVGNIIPPRQHDPSIAKPLEAICMTAMAKDREDRYGSALNIATDIEAWLADEPVSVYEDPWQKKVKRWAKRHRATVQSGGLAVVLLVVVWSGAAWSHSREMSNIRGVAQTSVQLSAKAAEQGDYKQARELLNEALGRTGDELDLADLRNFIVSRLQLVETNRLELLRRDVESKLEIAKASFRDGKYESARTALATLTALLADETELPEVSSEVRRQTIAVAAALKEQEAVADTRKRFNEFLVELDQARVRSSFPDEEDVSEDAQLAVEHARTALALFDLDRSNPFAEPPQNFSERLPWTREWQRETGRWPLAVLRDGTFELMLTAAEMEWWLARHESDEDKAAAALRSLSWTTKAKTIGLTSQALLAREANYLQEAGREEEAQRVFAQAKKIRPQTALDYYLIAENLRVRGLFNEALEFYLKAQQLSPDHYWVQHFLGLCYRNLGQHAAAASSFSACIARRPDYPWAYVLRGICSAELGQFDNCYADFDKAEQLEPTLFSVYVSRGVVLLTQGRFDESLENLERARELKPDSGKPLINIGYAYFALAEELQKPEADRRQPGNRPLEPLTDLELEQQVQQLYDKALTTLDLAEKNSTVDHPGLHQLRGQIFERRGQTAAALISYRRHLQLDDNSDRQAFTLKRIGRIHTLLREYDKAIDVLEQARRLRPTDSDTVLQLAEAQLQIHEDQKAVDRYTEFLAMVNGEIEKTVPAPHLIYNGIATALHGMRKQFDAVDYYTLSLMFEKRQPVPLTKRAWAFLEYGVDLAIRDFEAAKSLSPNNPDTLIGLASAYARKGKWQEAIRELEAARPLARQQAAQVGPQAFALFHNTATVYAGCVDAVVVDPRLADEAKANLTAQLSATAVGQLREALGIAKSDSTMLRAMLTAMQNDDALKSIRRSVAYREFVDELAKAADKTE